VTTLRTRLTLARLSIPPEDEQAVYAAEVEARGLPALLEPYVPSQRRSGE
jgi:hypothetical protein